MSDPFDMAQGRQERLRALERLHLTSHRHTDVTSRRASVKPYRFWRNTAHTGVVTDRKVHLCSPGF